MPAEIGGQTALRRGVVYLVTYVNRAKSLELHKNIRITIDKLTYIVMYEASPRLLIAIPMLP